MLAGAERAQTVRALGSQSLQSFRASKVNGAALAAAGMELGAASVCGRPHRTETHSTRFNVSAPASCCSATNNDCQDSVRRLSGIRSTGDDLTGADFLATGSTQYAA